MDAIRAGVSPRAASDKLGIRVAAVRAERRRDLTFAVEVDDAFYAAVGRSRPSRVDRLVDVACAHLTAAERARFAEAVRCFAPADDLEAAA